MIRACCLLMLSLVGASRLAVRPTLRLAACRAPVATMGFDVQSVDEKAVEELGVFSWPGLAKRTEDFAQSATSEEMLMVYVKEGSATVVDAEGTTTVAEGQMVIISDGDVKWTSISDGGVTLITATSPLVDTDEDDSGGIARWLGLGGGAAKPEISPEDEEVKDLDAKEAVILLGAGLLAGGLFSVGLKLVQTM